MLTTLKKLSMFSQLQKEQLQELLSFVKYCTYEEGEQILRQGQSGHQLFIIEQGEVRIQLEHPNVVPIASLSQGAFFGEMSCLTGDPVSASVYASCSLTLLSLNREGMLYLMEQSQAFRKHMIEAMVRRIQQSNERVAVEYSKSLYFMKRNELDDREKFGELIGVSGAIQSVKSAIQAASKHTGVVVIYGEVGVGKTHAAKRIHYTSHRQSEPVITLRATELNWNEWTSVMAAVGKGTLIVEEGEKLTIEQWSKLQHIEQNNHIVITSLKRLEGASTSIFVPPLRERTQDIPLLAKHFMQKENGTYDLLSEEAIRTLTLFPYLTKNVTELISVLEAAFLLSGGRTIQSTHLKFSRTKPPGVRPSVGLALGSGSLRGISHVGVLRVLEQEGIPIDYIAGTSVGSVIGGAYAAGMSLSDLEKAIKKLRWNNIVGFTFPKRSIFHNEPLAQFIESYLGDVNIEELSKPFAAIASDANSGEPHIMREGSLSKAIKASTAIPALMRPVQHQGKTLVDGAVVHPVPAALVRSMGADLVIAVNVCTENFTKGIPKNFVKSLLNTIDMMSTKIVTEELQLADIVIRPDLDHIVTGFKDLQPYMDAGKAAAKIHVQSIQHQCAFN